MKTDELPALGATGQFPDGKITEDDEGELQFAVGSNPDENLVSVRFGKPVAWLALPPENARALAQLLLKHADLAGAPPAT
jgi:hypothetical protein